jgi:hypothetical protein
MKVLKSSQISPFGGLNFVLNELDRAGVDKLLNEHLPSLPPQSKYSWKDIFYSFWSVLFCGGDCAEDLSVNFKSSLKSNPFIQIPSPDRLLERMKQLSSPSEVFDTPKGTKKHEFSFNESINRLNIKLIKKLALIKSKNTILDYDNTLIFSNKEDTAMTYMKRFGYCPGVGFIGNNIVYVENRNGNSDAQTLQQDTLKRMFALLNDEGIHIDRFRADGASYQLSTLSVIQSNVNKFYIRARMNQPLSEAINQINQWERVFIGEEEAFRGTTKFIPFQPTTKKNQQASLKPCKLVITKVKRDDGQINLFTGEAYNYNAIITDDHEMSNDQIVDFYNQRGAIEKEFDVLKNDFVWDKMPFSKLAYNTVFLVFTAMCRNIYSYIIKLFSRKCKNLSSRFRLKKFTFRFICIPGKWIRTARTNKLRIYGDIYFKT